MNVTLVVAKGPAQARTIQIRKTRAVVGRGKGCNLRIPSAAVSRRHCVLSFENGKLAVEDLDSFNGTFINGLRVNGKQRIRPGDQMQIGPLTFRVEYGRAESASAKLPPRKNKTKPVGTPAEEDESDMVPLAEVDESGMVPLELADPPEVFAVIDEESNVEMGLILEGDDPDNISLPVDENLHDLFADLDS